MFSAECPVVFDWINYLQNEFLFEYMEKQKTQNQGEREEGEVEVGEREEGEREEREDGMKIKSLPNSVDSSNETSTRPSDKQLPNCSVGDETTIAHSPAVTHASHCDSSSTALRSTLPFPPLLSPVTRHPCQVFLRSTSQFNDIEAFDQYECHREFLRNKHECCICFLLISGEQFCEPCPDCGQAFCTDCLLGYCQVCSPQPVTTVLHVLVGRELKWGCYVCMVDHTHLFKRSACAHRMTYYIPRSH